MYCPAAFRQNDLPSLHAQIQASGLALLSSAGTQGLQASHLPLLLEPGEGEFGTLYGHFARANPHWRDLAAGAEALVVFSGPDAYVHPGWYPAKAEHGKVVPTWNYIAAHAWGQAEVFDEPERLLQLVSRLSDRHEQGRAQPWAVEDAPRDYIDIMLRAIVGFALPIRRIEGKWKLSQNRSTLDQAGVRTGLATSNNPRDHELAAQMNPTD
ncbi:FMN-binding negative transcriptional regulator [Pseudomonas chengduensis]|jgi:transcriptional regulator|nr:MULTISPECIES: FMN-binding negative transcriptional regulator [Pseudomonas]PZQ95084.1 MAG: transcriptional regulator [Flavobacterium psychrophilum]MDH0622731.1 FMN-binding negative transcriptional regulator [Pseudomonas chengduensis]MDH1213538.1 FMN-binding negative transcriptional regulator [Pseudomonas chengduensis]MDH1282932.1 FMN-binding negative transcriptional regulator [Pseudomonas chengduensis]MDH1666946.1 FMN-binding negative transcriptional regulator [Pseudomonas chengduensis]|tara:strand:- start:46 stop:678 length:633 start_codon:yes stop_codon:yes gene_type:complete